MSELFLLGAGGFGREVAAMVQHTNGVAHTWDLLGFLDDNAALHGRTMGGLTILGGLEVLSAYPDALCACCVADPAVRKSIVERAAGFGAKWATLVHHTAVIMHSATIGEGCILQPFSAVTADACVGEHVHVNYHSAIGHDGRVGDYVTLSSYVDITGKVTLGEGVFVGSGASILPGISVGSYAVIGGGALVHRDVAAWTVAVGVPARVIKERQPHKGGPSSAAE
jgi:sugar O-acyltransferase (sialic acid O-acetyltransferase NeuD family)